VLARDTSAHAQWHGCCGGIGMGICLDSSLQSGYTHSFLTPLFVVTEIAK
jgi:hypothetical protein